MRGAESHEPPPGGLHLTPHTAEKSRMASAWRQDATLVSSRRDLFCCVGLMSVLELVLVLVPMPVFLTVFLTVPASARLYQSPW